MMWRKQMERDRSASGHARRRDRHAGKRTPQGSTETGAHLRGCVRRLPRSPIHAEDGADGEVGVDDGGTVEGVEGDAEVGVGVHVDGLGDLLGAGGVAHVGESESLEEDLVGEDVDGELVVTERVDAADRVAGGGADLRVRVEARGWMGRGAGWGGVGHADGTGRGRAITLWAMAREASDMASMTWRVSLDLTFSRRNSSRYWPSLADTATLARAERAERTARPWVREALAPAKAEALEETPAERATAACETGAQGWDRSRIGVARGAPRRICEI